MNKIIKFYIKKEDIVIGVENENDHYLSYQHLQRD